MIISSIKPSSGTETKITGTEMEVKIRWIPFDETKPPKSKHGDKKYIFLLVDKIPIVLAYWGEEFSPTKGMTHWFPIPEVPKEIP